MTLWWIGDVVLLVVVLPVVVYLLRGVLQRGQEHRPERAGRSPTVAAAGSKDLDAAALLLTTQDQVDPDGRGGRELRRLARRDPRRRVIGGADTCSHSWQPAS